MTEVQLEALKAVVDLRTMSLDELLVLNCKLSQMREACGGAERRAVYEYALEVNVWITVATTAREVALKVARDLDPAKAALHQGVSLGGVASDGRFDALVEERVATALRAKGARP